ncbi:MAG TPA: nitroreductase family protein [Acidimicrobiales bacterium]|jgi:nitroreductase|nr:nitroreductase family protein [Acidimicrobiales bacterium]
MELRQALTTTGAVREFADEPVADDVVERILDTARFAPSGGNRQAWRAIVVKDPDTRARLRDLYLTGWYEYLAIGAAGLVPWAPVTDRAAEAAAIQQAPTMKPPEDSPGGFAEQLDRAPVLIVLLADLRGLAAVDRDHHRYTLVGGASIYPFAWSILLAAHDEGLGGVITTMLCREEPAVLAELGVPDGWALAAALVLGRPAGTRATRLKRGRVAEFASFDRFDGDPVGG